MSHDMKLLEQLDDALEEVEQFWNRGLINELVLGLAARVKELEKTTDRECPRCGYFAPENEKDWPDSECVVCTQMDVIEGQAKKISGLEAAVRWMADSDNVFISQRLVDQWLTDHPIVREVIEKGDQK